MNVKYNFLKSKILFFLIFTVHTQQSIGMDKLISFCTQSVRDGSYAAQIAIVFGGSMIYNNWNDIKEHSIENKNIRLAALFTNNITGLSPTLVLMGTTLLADHFFGGNGINKQLLVTHAMGTSLAFYLKKVEIMSVHKHGTYQFDFCRSSKCKKNNRVSFVICQKCQKGKLSPFTSKDRFLLWIDFAIPLSLNAAHIWMNR